MSIEKAISDLTANISALNKMLTKVLEKGSQQDAVEEKSAPQADLDQVREAMNNVVRSKGREAAVKILESFHGAKTLEDLIQDDFSKVIEKAQAELEVA